MIGVVAGVLAGLASALWGYWKDVHFAKAETFKPLSFLRSILVGATGGALFQFYGVHDFLICCFVRVHLNE